MDMTAPLIAYSIALFIAAVIPGPGIAALVGQSLGGGRRASVLFLSGIVMGDIVYLTVAIAGLAAIAELFAGAFLLIKMMGGAYLIYLALKLWTSAAGAARVEANQNRKGLKAFLAGFAVTLGNPKTIIFYLALLPTILDLDAVGLRDWFALCVLTILVLLAALIPYVVLAFRARMVMTASGALRVLNRVAAGVIGGAGLFVLWQAASTLTRRA